MAKLNADERVKALASKKNVEPQPMDSTAVIEDVIAKHLAAFLKENGLSVD